jgi:hypothetical protein
MRVRVCPTHRRIETAQKERATQTLLMVGQQIGFVSMKNCKLHGGPARRENGFVRHKSKMLNVHDVKGKEKMF